MKCVINRRSRSDVTIIDDKLWRRIEPMQSPTRSSRKGPTPHYRIGAALNGILFEKFGQ
ncbi:putative peptide synthase [Burkholderia pseudomallei]|nr:putative peptide synthase [Burkholderia pseudomallei]